LKSYWKSYVWNGFIWPIWTFETQVMAKRNAKSQIGSLTSTTKSRELTRFTCVRVVCDIPLENYWRGLQLCFKPHFNPRSTSEVMGSQSHDNPNFDNLSPHLAILRQNAIWMWALWRGIEYIIRGKVVASPKSGPWWVLWVRVGRDFS
jgi:hypothetical protein